MAEHGKMGPPDYDESRYSWEIYKKEVQIWAELTKLADEKKGSAFWMTLTGKAKSVVQDMTIEEIKAKDGLTKMLTKLEDVFKPDANQAAYMAYQEFEMFKRPDEMKLPDFVIKFEELNSRIKVHKMVLPDGVLAYRFLQSANLREEDMNLCRATIQNFTYDEMKKKVMALYGDRVQLGFTVKEEPVFYSGYQSSRGGFRGRTNRGRFNSNQRGRGQAASSQNKKMNPPGKYGTASTCACCGSRFHWIKDCPDYSNNEKHESRVHYNEADEKQSYSEVNISLLTKADGQMKEFVGETIGCAVVDSGCAKTVAGKQWFKCYKDLPGVPNEIKIEASNSVFRFGKGGPSISAGKVKIPAMFGTKHVTIETELVEDDVPLLLSKEALKKAGTVLDFNNDTAVMFNEQQPLIATTSGHYAIPLSPVVDTAKQEKQITLFAGCTENPDFSKVAEKLHRQFCHCSAERLSRLIQSSKLWDSKKTKELISAVTVYTQSCKICKQFKKPPPIPVVSIPMATDFNDVVAMDLIVLTHGKYIVHLIDLFSRYSAACVRTSKRQECIVEAIIKMWIAYFGSPRKFLADNGGEFANHEYRSMCEAMNIEMMKTAAESPWSNGVCERHNAVIKESVLKTIEDTNCSADTAVAWAISAKNSLHGHSGFAPNVLVFGRNTNVPSVITNELPAMSNKDLGIIVAENIKAMQSARENFIKSESSEKIKRALTHNIRTSSESVFRANEKVFFKRNDDRKWRGPAKVIGQDGKILLLKYDNQVVRAHVSRVTSTGRENRLNQTSGSSTDEPKTQKTRQIHSTILDSDDDESIHSHSGDDEVVVKNEPVEIEMSHEQGQNIIPNVTFQEESAHLISVDDGIADETNEMCVPTETILQSPNNIELIEQNVNSSCQHTGGVNRSSAVDTDMTDSVPIRVADVSGDTNQSQIGVLPIVNSRVLYKLYTSDEWVTGYIHSRAGKATGKYKGCFNVLDEKSQTFQVVDFFKPDVKWEPKASQVLITSADKEANLAAKLKELENWKKNEVYNEVPYQNQKLITTRWVITPKEIDGVITTKARLVVRGFEDQDSEKSETNSPTCTKEAIRIALATIAMNGWNCKSIDAKAAFLQGNEIKRDIFVKPPKEASTDKVWKLRKAAYGLNEASRCWYNKVNDELTKLGIERSKFDEAFFIYKNQNKLVGLISVHVDDFLNAGTDKFHCQLSELKKKIVFGTESESPMMFLGINISQQDDKTIQVHQEEYCKEIEFIDINKKDKGRSLSPDEQYMYRKIVGQLNWLASQSRPDLSFDVCQLSTKLNQATVHDVIFANKTLKKANSQSLLLKFNRLCYPVNLVAFCDASYANLPDGSSQGGSIIFLSDDQKRISPICWWSKKLRRVCKSTEAAETMAMLDAIDACIWLSSMLKEINGEKFGEISINTDNKSLYENVHSTTAVAEKRLRVEIAAIRESIRRDEVKVKWVPHEKQLADCLTKQGADSSALFEVIKKGRFQE